MKIHMREGDTLTIEIGGREISLLCNPAEDYDSYPELDIMLPADMCANCWGEHLAPGQPLPSQPWTVECRQIVIPIEPAVREWSGSPNPDDPDNSWIDDETGEITPCIPPEQEQS